MFSKQNSMPIIVALQSEQDPSKEFAVNWNSLNCSWLAELLPVAMNWILERLQGDLLTETCEATRGKEIAIITIIINFKLSVLTVSSFILGTLVNLPALLSETEPCCLAC
jgi:hypothetical protein